MGLNSGLLDRYDSTETYVSPQANTELNHVGLFNEVKDTCLSPKVAFTPRTPVTIFVGVVVLLTGAWSSQQCRLGLNDLGNLSASALQITASA